MKKLVLLVLVIIVLAGGWYLGSPLFLEKEVNEDFPTIDHLPTAEELEAMSEDELARIEDDVMEMAAGKPDTVMAETMPAPGADPTFPLILSTGKFQGADSFHKGEGVAAVIDVDGTRRVLRFESFSVTNGPDLRVYLTAHPNPQSQDDVTSGAYIELSKLKGNKGNQNYDIPDDIDVDDFNTVLIYCKPFHVVFATAPLGPIEPAQ